MNFLKFGFLVRDDEYSRSLSKDVEKFLINRGHVVYRFDHNCPINDINFVIVFGGDGTILGAANNCGSIPIFGINTGTLGFLSTQYNILEEALSNLIKGDFELDHRNRLSCKVFRDGKQINHFTALNDIVIKGSVAKVVKLQVFCGRDLMGYFPADGLIVSTPTGSTGYNLSAGGPIIEPGTPVNIITPICSHTLNLRPFVTFRAQPIKVIVDAYSKQILVSADGQRDQELEVGDEIVINTSTNYFTKFISFEGNSGYFNNLRRKMGWV
jgi:NAD+ kinase